MEAHVELKCWARLAGVSWEEEEKSSPSLLQPCRQFAQQPVKQITDLNADRKRDDNSNPVP